VGKGEVEDAPGLEVSRVWKASCQRCRAALANCDMATALRASSWRGGTERERGREEGERASERKEGKQMKGSPPPPFARQVPARSIRHSSPSLAKAAFRQNCPGDILCAHSNRDGSTPSNW